MDAHTNDKIMALYNSPMLVTIKNLLNAKLKGEFDFDGEKMKGILQRFLQKKMDFRGSITVRNDDGVLLFRSKKRGNKNSVSYADPMSMSSQILKDIPKDGKWYKHPFHNVKVRYTPDSISYYDEITEILNDTYNTVEKNNLDAYEEINDYLVSVNQWPILNQNDIDDIHSSIDELQQNLNTLISGFQDYCETNPSSDDLYDAYEEVQLDIKQLITYTMTDVTDMLYNIIDGEDELTSDQEDYIYNIIKSTVSENESTIRSSMNTISDIIYEAYKDNSATTDSMDVPSGSSEDDYYELGYSSGVEISQMPFPVSNDLTYYQDKSMTAFSVPEEYEDDFISGFEDGYDASVGAVSSSMQTDTNSDAMCSTYKTIKDDFKMFIISKLFKYVYKNPCVIDNLTINEKEYNKGLQFGKYVKDNQDFIYFCEKELAMSFIKGIYDVVVKNKPVEPIIWM